MRSFFAFCTAFANSANGASPCEPRQSHEKTAVLPTPARLADSSTVIASRMPSQIFAPISGV